jgi:hypothetical protein
MRTNVADDFPIARKLWNNFPCLNSPALKNIRATTKRLEVHLPRVSARPKSPPRPCDRASPRVKVGSRLEIAEFVPHGDHRLLEDAFRASIN